MWDISQEQLLEKYADECAVRENLHRVSFYYYSSWNNYLQLPVIVLSAISGSLQFLSQSIVGLEKTIILGTGTLSVLVTLISAIQTYLKFGESKKIHESATNSWLNLFHEIQSQLALRRDLRQDSDEFVKHVLQRYQQLFELSPIVEQTFINTIKTKIKKSNTTIKVPIYLNGLSPMKVFQDDDEYSDNTQDI